MVPALRLVVWSAHLSVRTAQLQWSPAVPCLFRLWSPVTGTETADVGGHAVMNVVEAVLPSQSSEDHRTELSNRSSDSGEPSRNLYPDGSPAKVDWEGMGPVAAYSAAAAYLQPVHITP